METANPTNGRMRIRVRASRNLPEVLSPPRRGMTKVAVTPRSRSRVQLLLEEPPHRVVPRFIDAFEGVILFEVYLQVVRLSRPVERIDHLHRGREARVHVAGGADD